MFTRRWNDWIQKPFDEASIRVEAERYERAYWFWTLLNIGSASAGLIMFLMTFRDGGVAAYGGLFVVLVALVNSVLIKLWAHVMLSMFRLAAQAGKR